MASTTTHRLFFAAWPEPGVRDQLAALAARLGADYPARWVKPHRFHLTLAFLGTDTRFDAALADLAVRAAATVYAPAFVWRPDRVRGFPGERAPCVLGASLDCPPLVDLHRYLKEALAGAGVVPPDKRAYRAHVTLGYGRGRGHAMPEKPLLALDFPIRSFVLLHSVGGERDYRELGRWPLDGAGAAFSIDPVRPAG